MIRPVSKGFTLIELVVVITILGILAAFAVPRFVSLENQARSASVQALEGSLRSAAALARGMAMASGNPATIQMEGRTITLVNGYPNAATIGDTIADLSGFNPPTVAGTATTFTRQGARDPAACFVRYTEAAAAGAAPTILRNTDNC
jgi:MSHA pilin protein MshA